MGYRNRKDRLTGLVLAAALAMAAHAPAAAMGKKPVELVPDGEPVTCIDRHRINSTRVIDDQTIDFVMAGGKIMRNTLPNRCPGLGFERAFMYSTSQSQLCNVDIITVLQTSGGPMRGASCGLGKFTPMKKADAAEDAKAAAD
ncbi:hypothetical protein ACUJ46_01190 [Sandaracinobacteroides sp. A072]|uniref:hypothetical protein n=1 Tax=Sandaracinobacteroides sp. A072 TaxID=3461146 RepID=UPI0040420550